MAQPEARISRDIMTAIRAAGHFCFKVHGSETMMAGLPDIVVCADGYFIGVETKTPTMRNNVSPRQHFVHDQIRASYGHVFVVTSSAEALRKIKEFLSDREPVTPRQAYTFE